MAAVRDKIVARTNPVRDGRVIPSDNDLPIGAGRRIEATVLFLDISKFSARPNEAASDQTTMLQVITLFFSEWIRVVVDYGGVVEKNTGDGLMAYFAASDWSESPQQRAVAAAMTMFAASDAMLNPIMRNSALEPIDYRVCIDHGWITVANVGAPRSFNDWVAIGTTANIASKMLAEADPNTILLGSDVIKGLPAEWMNHITLKMRETGWTYIATGQPYSFWLFSGRWRFPE